MVGSPTVPNMQASRGQASLSCPTAPSKKDAPTPPCQPPKASSEQERPYPHLAMATQSGLNPPQASPALQKACGLTSQVCAGLTQPSSVWVSEGARLGSSPVPVSPPSYPLSQGPVWCVPTGLRHRPTARAPTSSRGVTSMMWTPGSTVRGLPVLSVRLSVSLTHTLAQPVAARLTPAGLWDKAPLSSNR